MEISHSPMSSPNDDPCHDVKILKGHTSEVCTCLFSYLPYRFSPPIVRLIESYFIPCRFLPVLGIHQLHFLRLGEYKPLCKENTFCSQKYLFPVNLFYFEDNSSSSFCSFYCLSSIILFMNCWLFPNLKQCFISSI